MKVRTNKNHEYKKSTIINKNSERSSDESTHYVDKKKFYEALVARKPLVDAAIAAGEQKPRPSDYIGECILKICTNLARKHQFSGYHFKEEMIGDAVIHCIRYIDSFDINKSTNPFSYFTQAAYYQFIKRISLEKEQLYIKCKSTMGSAALGETVSHDSAGNKVHANDNLDLDTEFMDSFVDEFERKAQEKKQKAKQALLEKTKAHRDATHGLETLIEMDD